MISSTEASLHHRNIRSSHHRTLISKAKNNGGVYCRMRRGSRGLSSVAHSRESDSGCISRSRSLARWTKQ